MTKRLFPALLALVASAAQAHEGHGLPGASHWHAGDTLLLVAGVALAAWAIARGRKP
jgi:hypothetical protein